MTSCVPILPVLQGFDLTKLMVPGQKVYSLPFDVVLNNNVALTYFIGKLAFLVIICSCIVCNFPCYKTSALI